MHHTLYRFDTDCTFLMDSYDIYQPYYILYNNASGRTDAFDPWIIIWIYNYDLELKTKCTSSLQSWYLV